MAKMRLKKFLKKEIIVRGDFNPLLLNELEKHYIRLHATKKPNGYNLTDGGSSMKKVTDHTRKKIGDSHRGRKLTKEQYDKIIGTSFKKGQVPWNKGTKGLMGKGRNGSRASEETKEKQRVAWKRRKIKNPPKPKLLKSGIDAKFKKGRVSVNKGKKLPQEHALAIGRGNTGKRRTVEHLSKIRATKLSRYGENMAPPLKNKSERIKGYKLPKRKIAQYDLDDQLIKIWDTLAEAKKATGAKKASSVANNRSVSRTSGGFIWKWIDDNGNQLNQPQ